MVMKAPLWNFNGLNTSDCYVLSVPTLLDSQ